ncbi:MAG: hypothetical protein ABJJ44_17055 [Paraglaciecola sp.]
MNLPSLLRVLIFTFLLCVSGFVNSAPIHFIIDSESFKTFFEKDSKPVNMHEATYQLIFNQIKMIPKISIIPDLRMKYFLDSEQPTCTFYRLQTPERTNRYIFSTPTDIFLGVKLYQHKSSKPIDERFLDKVGRLTSISNFFNDETNAANLLLMSGKSYGFELDQQIEEINPISKIMISGESPNKAFLGMFLKKRVDYIIYYPTVFLHFPEEAKTLRSYPIKGSPPYMFGRIMCNNTTASQAFVTQVNQALKKLYVTDEFLNAILDFTPEDEHGHIKHIIQTKFIPEALQQG